MKAKIIPIGVVIIIILTSINVIAINTEEDKSIKNAIKYDTASFSKATIETIGEYVSINIKEANSVLKNPGKPELCKAEQQDPISPILFQPPFF